MQGHRLLYVVKRFYEIKYIIYFGYICGMRQSGCQFSLQTTRMPKNMNLPGPITKASGTTFSVSRRPCVGSKLHRWSPLKVIPFFIENDGSPIKSLAIIRAKNYT